MMNAGQLKEHTLNRLGYGPSIWASNRYDQLGHDGYVNEQLSGAGLQAFDSADWLQPDPSQRPAWRPEGKVHLQVTHQRQLELVMFEWAFNKLNVAMNRNDPGRPRQLPGFDMPRYIWNDILANAMGDYGTMLVASAKAVGMLHYLSNRFNVRTGLNENYGREVMELHTVTLNAGYNAADVDGATKILSGMRVVNIVKNGANITSADYAFQSVHHWTTNDGPKVVLGQQFPIAAAEGQAEIDEFLIWLASHQSTAMATGDQLAVRFISETPSPAAINAGANAYTDNQRSLRKAAEGVLKHADFKDVANFRSKAKRPTQYASTALAAMGAQSAADYAAIETNIMNLITASGERVFMYADPTGLPEAHSFWISTAAMQNRFQMATQIAYHQPLVDRLKNRSGATGANAETTIDQLAAVMVPGGLAIDVKDAILQHVSQNMAWTDNERVRESARLILCSPEFVKY